MGESMTVIGIVVDERAERAPRVQEVITRYGEDIVCRMGVPGPSKQNGLITVVFNGETAKAERFYRELEEVGGVAAQMMRFRH
jgi:putative iron-only hydrogenase system regulator